jgi:hypothetical protein
MAIQRGRSERRGLPPFCLVAVPVPSKAGTGTGESYSLSYVEPLSDARTKLGGFFSILLGTIVTKRAEGNVTSVYRDRNS